MFYDADTIGEVYPENELVEWVWEAFGAKTEPMIKWRDGEMAHEWTNEWCGRQALKRLRSFGRGNEGGREEAEVSRGSVCVEYGS